MHESAEADHRPLEHRQRCISVLQLRFGWSGTKKYLKANLRTMHERMQSALEKWLNLLGCVWPTNG